MRRATRSVIVAALVAMLVFGACGGRRGRGDREEATDPRCQAVADADLTGLAERITLDAEDKPFMRHGYAVESRDQAGRWFVSVELVRDEDAADQPGDILTWVAASPDGTEAFSLEENAHRYTDLPRAGDEVNIRDDGAIESRACVSKDRPSTSGGL